MGMKILNYHEALVELQLVVHKLVLNCGYAWKLPGVIIRTNTSLKYDVGLCMKQKLLE